MMSKYILPLLLIVGCQAEQETPEAVDNQPSQISFMDLPEGFPSNEQESQVLIDMVRTSIPNNRWWGAGDTQWSMYSQRLLRRPIATEESRRWLREWLNRGEN